MKYRILKLACLVLSVSIFSIACNTTNSDESPPQLPPSESMSVDFSAMESASNQSQAKIAESNFNTAVFAVGIAKVILTANLAIPKILITAAQEEDPESISNSEWEWNYTTAANGQNFGVRLTATVGSNDDVTWNFYVTNSAEGIDNELFFTGTSDYEASSGTWTYFNPQSGQELSVVSWERSEIQPRLF
jgi:hypothetical protein